MVSCFASLLLLVYVPGTLCTLATNLASTGEAISTDKISRPDLTAITRPVLKLKRYGEKSGTFFDDVNNLTMPATIVGIRSIDIGSLYQVDYIQVKYVLSNGSLYTAPEHGDGIFTPETITLDEDEYVAQIDGLTNGQAMVNQLTITTYKPSIDQVHIFGPYGTNKVNANISYTYKGNILGFYGSYGKYVLSSFGAYTLAPVKKSAFYGSFSSKGGKNFTDHPDAMFPAAVKINKIFIRHGNQINSIEAEYQLYGGKVTKGPNHGGNKGNLTVINLDRDEHIIGIKGTIAGAPFKQLLQLGFITVNEQSEIKEYGPYGELCGVISISLNANIVGFAGSVFGNVLTGFQVFYFDN